MSKFKKVLALLLVVALTAALSVSLTMAYLQDDDSDVNVMTLGNVYIDQIEQERDSSGKLVDFTRAKPLYPAVYAGNSTDDSIPWDDAANWPVVNDEAWKTVDKTSTNVVDKFVTVKNTGDSPAYVRTIIAFEGDPINGTDIHVIQNSKTSSDSTVANAFASTDYIENVTIKGVRYDIIVYTYSAALAPDATTIPSLKQVYMDHTCGNDEVAKYGETYDILVLSQAVQVKGFESVGAASALDTAFGEVNDTNVQTWFTKDEFKIPTVVNNAEDLGKALDSGSDVILTANIADAPVTTKAPYGNYYGVALNGGTLDGAGNTLDFDLGELKDGKADNYGVMTSGGTIKNVTITGVFRGIMIMNPTEDIYIDNVTIGDDDVCYAINTGEGDGTHSLYVTNSTIKGWSSYGTAIKDLYFTNCTFAQGEYYTNVFGRLVKPYVDTVFENCEFNSKFYIDLSAFEGKQIVLKNCTVNGVKLTAENWKDLIVSESACGEGQISIELKDGTYMSASNIVDYVIFE